MKIVFYNPILHEPYKKKSTELRPNIVMQAFKSSSNLIQRALDERLSNLSK